MVIIPVRSLLPSNTHSPESQEATRGQGHVQVTDSSPVLKRNVVRSLNSVMLREWSEATNDFIYRSPMFTRLRVCERHTEETWFL